MHPQNYSGETKILSCREVTIHNVTQSIYGAESIGIRFWKANENTDRLVFFVNCFCMFLVAHILSQIDVSRYCLNLYCYDTRMYSPTNKNESRAICVIDTW